MRLSGIIGFAFLAACSSSAPLVADGGSADHPTGTAGAATTGAAGGGGGGATGAAGAAGTTGAAGAAGSGSAGTSGTGGSMAFGGANGAAGAAGSPPLKRAVDMLFMIDDSSSMTPLQEKLVQGFPTIISALEALPGGMPSLHVGIVSSSMGAGRDANITGCPPGGDQGIFHVKPLGTTCSQASLAAGQNFLIDDGAGNANFTGTLSDMFSCIAPLGAHGCGFEHQLESVLRALGADGAVAPAQNTGFLRRDALLHVILLTNEDDCSAPPDSDLFDSTSMLVSDPLGPLQSFRCNEFGHLCGGTPPPRTPANPPVDLSGTCVSAEDGRLIRVADVVTALKVLKEDPSRVLVSVISGPPSPYIVNVAPSQVKGDPSMWPYVQHSCMASDGTYADPAVRLQQLVSAFGARGLFAGICDEFATTMQAVSKQLTGALPQ